MIRNPRRLRLNRTPGLHDGFVMMFTLIAVALGGYVMIESAPDFSNYAVLTRAQQFERNLGRLRQSISSRRFFLTTSDGIDILAAGDNPANELLTPDELETIVSQLVVPPASTVRSSELSLGTTPVDPFVPSREWGEVFWAGSYNFIRNPSFYNLAGVESRDPTALRVFYVHENGGTTSLSTTDRIARVKRSLVSPGNIFKHVSVSKDGSRFLAATDLLHPPPGPNFFDAVTFDVQGGNRSFASDMSSSGGLGITTHSMEYPEWSPQADRLAYVESFNFADGGGNQDKRMVIRAPELTGLPLDVIGRTQTGGGVPFPQFRRMGRGNWSPDGTLLAFWVQEASGGPTYIVIYNYEREQWFLPHEDATGGVSGFLGGERILCKQNGTPISWSPDSDSFVYVDNGDEIQLADNVRSGFAGMTMAVPTGIVADGTIVDIQWAPPSMSPGTSTNNSYFYVDEIAAGVGSIRLRRMSDPVNNYIQITNHSWVNAVPALPLPSPREARSFSISPGGTEILYIDSGRKQLRTVSIDGFDDQALLVLGSDDLLEAGFLQPPPGWIYPRASTRKLLPSDPAGFDHQGWRIFLNDNSLFSGDARFGDGYLQVAPPSNPEQFLFDNGIDIFRITEEAPTETVLDPTGTPEPKTLGKLRASWGWRGVNYVAAESQDVTGGTPSDIFKQIVGTTVSGTTVLVTTGTTPEIGPDNQLLAISRRMSDSTTYPPNTAQYPPVDMDLWVVEANGGPNPTPTNLTPGTTATAESNPSWSPDGNFVYFQRESQVVSRFLGNHASGIYRTSRWGGSITPVIPEASIQPAWNNGYYVSALEFYDPAVSPDGTRLAFIARERLLAMGSLAANLSSTRVGEIIGEALYVKDLHLSTPAVCLLRSIDGEIGMDIQANGDAAPGEDVDSYFPLCKDGTTTDGDYWDHTGDKAYADHGFHRPSWSPDGLQIFLNRTFPRNRWFPQKGLHRHGSTPGDIPSLRFKSYHQMLRYSQLIKVKATHPADDRGITKLPDSTFDPPADNFDIVVQNEVDDSGAPDRYEANPQGSGPGPIFLWGPGPPPLERRQILHAQVSRGAYAFQRILQDVPATELAGLSLGVDYVLSGYARSRGGIGGLHAAQIMCQLLNNQGLAIELTTPGSNIFQIGIADVGGQQWTRFSAGVRFDPNPLKGDALIVPGNAGWGDAPPFSLLLSLYSLGGVGNTVEFTGLKMERAYDSRTMAPTAFYPGWILHSSSLVPDPNHPKSHIFER